MAMQNPDNINVFYHLYFQVNKKNLKYRSDIFDKFLINKK